MQETSSIPPDHLTSISTADLVNRLPLHLLKSDTIPPAPNRLSCRSAFDWLPDFAGYAWIAYGASSCLVISHFPSPLSPQESAIGPIFRQVFELSDAAAVADVAWSPAYPSVGDLAAASGNCIRLFSHDSATSQGCFCWSQTAALVQSTKVEVVTWTGSGDGIVAGGIEVILWKKKGKSWETAWKFRAEEPQALVSATWSVEGPLATSAYASDLSLREPLSDATKCVLVFYHDGNSEYAKAVLHHPQPVSAIQWRPSTRRCMTKDARPLARQVLLTCCLDGVVRLWSEVDEGKPRKIGKDVNDQKTWKRSFCVAAAIEINQVLNGTLGVDVNVRWATDIQGIAKADVGTSKMFFTEGDQLDKSGKCEWLIGFGPKMLLTFWAVHCLDEVSPLRFPRVTLWKQHDLQVSGAVSQQNGNSNSLEQSSVHNVVICRDQLFGLPTLCSLIQLLPSNSFKWLQLYAKAMNNMQEELLIKSRPENLLLSSVDKFINVDGHTGCILQVVMHPCSCEVRLAASLDSNGIILFWSVSNNCSQIAGHPTLNPIWNLCGKLPPRDACPTYTSLRWAPSLLGEDPVLLMGHAGGIDCFLVKVPHIKEVEIACHNLCTIPFASECANRNEPTNIFTMLLSSVCNQTCNVIQFMLFGIWKEKFQAISWKVTCHSFDLSESCHLCSSDSIKTAGYRLQKFEKSFSGKSNSIIVELCSVQLPYPYCDDFITSFSVISPANLISSALRKCVLGDQLSCSYSSYHLATGCSDGSLKLWRSNPDVTQAPNLCWELVGVLAAHDGPISAISMTSCGRKIATICSSCRSNVATTLCIWESVHIAGSGSFILEDSLSLDGELVELKWLSLGNGQSLLGICMRNELRIYAPKLCGIKTLLSSERSVGMHIWSCLAVMHTSVPIHGFLWGSMATAVVIHDNYFSVYGQWLSSKDGTFHTDCSKDTTHYFSSATMRDYFSPVYFDGDVEEPKELVMVDSASGRISGQDNNIKLNEICQSGCYLVAGTVETYNSGIKHGLLSMLEAGEKLYRPLPVFHPDVLLLNISSGHWKRAYIALQHLVEFLSSDHAFSQSYSFGNSGHSVPPIHLSNYLEARLPSCSTEGGCPWNASSASLQFEKGSMQFGLNSMSVASGSTSSQTKYGLNGFVEPIEKYYESAAITSIEKFQILAIIDLLNEVSDPHSSSAYKSLDEPGRRFWVDIRFQHLYSQRRFGRVASIEDLIVGSNLIGWALHSDCQEILFGSILSNEPSWQEMRALRIGFWFSNAAQLRTRVEKLARSQYLKNKDPKECALLYVALNRLQVLAGLFKISKDEKDKPMVGFLARNFQDEKNKAAALKNAYVLMGRHQLELAIAFFLLGGDTNSAISVCAKNLGDEQLALVICRLVEGYGGPLEHHLILKFILPSAIEKGDYWLASLLEWVLGNYSQSFVSMLPFLVDSDMKQTYFASIHASFLDPSIGQYCLTLATRNNMRNAVGEQNAAVMCRWSNLMAATALQRCGLPLESLEHFSSSSTILEDTDQGNILSIGNSEILSRILIPSSSASSNWLSGGVAWNLELHAKLDLAMQYLSRLIGEHPSWAYCNLTSSGPSIFSWEPKLGQYKTMLETFQYKLCHGLAKFEQTFSLVPISLLNMILVFLCNSGLLFIGYDILHQYTFHDQLQDISCDGRSFSYPVLPKLLLEAAEEYSCSLSRFIVACGMFSSQPWPNSITNGSLDEIRASWSFDWGIHMQNLILLLRKSRSIGQLFSDSSTEEVMKKFFIVLELFEYLLDFAFAWFQRNLKCLALMMEPLMTKFSDEQTPYEVNVESLRKFLRMFVQSMSTSGAVRVEVPKWKQDELNGIPEDERWQIIGASLWQHMSCFLKGQLNQQFQNLGESYSSDVPLSCIPSWSLCSACEVPATLSIHDPIKLVSVMMANILEITLVHVSAHRVQQFALFLWHKALNDLPVPTLVWLEKCHMSQQKATINPPKQAGVDLTGNVDFSVSEVFWDICADPKIISFGFAQENLNWSNLIKQKPLRKWSDSYEGMMEEVESNENNSRRQFGGDSANNGTGFPARGLLGNGFTFLSSGKKDATLQRHIMSFHNPKEIYRRNGELLEALCVNSIDQQEAALAGNQKGIIFINREYSLHSRNYTDYIWSKADWPHNGWAGSESTPVPTCISPGIGLGSRKGAHLGLGGATIGLGSLARPGRDLTGGGVFGLAGYAGGGASGLGWEIQEDFEEFTDPPATLENISTRALSSHPCRPLFLVGSSNTHIYLWKFGKERAIATYGVLPAANVPPPYALASISSLQFDHYGHRFATAASDGTVCTWQLEVGGRSNIQPTESSLCFNNQASDVTYVTSSGSVIAVGGCSSNGVNVVIWDTLAPHTSSRASIVCHEGGTRALAVFDNDMGSGSISPIIVTGGKGGDVGLHDFRYIATGKTKRHRRPDNDELNKHRYLTTEAPAGVLGKAGVVNSNGMLWYIPNAHLGSVTSICTIPNTSLFLTGSKDGDVKLWDAKRSKLVFQWSKLHERHTFLQPSSRGYGGVVRAAVTDIQVVSDGFLTCGGDGCVKLVQLKNYEQHET